MSEDPYSGGVHDGLILATVKIDLHIPSLTNEAEEEIDSILWGDLNRVDRADLAIRTCSCGKRIDGFYEYVDHLKEVLRG